MHSYSSPSPPQPPNNNGAAGGLSSFISEGHCGGEKQQQQQTVGSGEGSGSNTTLFSLNNKRRNDDHSSSVEDDSNNNNNIDENDGERQGRLVSTMTPKISRDVYYSYINKNNNDMNNSFLPQQQTATQPSLSVWPVPDVPTMQARWNFRERIQRETMEHRRTILFPSSSNIPSTSSSSSSFSSPSACFHHHHQSSSSSNHHHHNLNYSDHSHSINRNHVTTVAPAVRNICTILCDRERFGAQALSHGPRPPRPSRPPRKGGCSSPSTVLESLLTPTNGGATASASATATLMDTSTPTTPKVNEPHIAAAGPEEEEEEDSNGDGEVMDVMVAPSGSYTLGTSPDTTQGPPPLPLPGLSSLEQQPSFPQQEQQQQQPSSSALPLPNHPRQRVIFPLRIVQEICFFGESYSATRYQSSFLHHLGGNEEPLDAQGQRPASSPAVSTISVAFSPDSQTLASTHGDHTVKISCCHSGRLLQSLEGHPRTPWTVKYHPTQAAIVASGCLGHQVRVWNWKKVQLLQMVRLEYAIISLSFHPSGTLLAIANGTRVHLWSLVLPGEEEGHDHNHNNSRSTAISTSNNNSGRNNSQNSSTPSILELDQRHMLRCVHFPPNGKTLILGGVNPMTEDARRARSARTANSAGGGGMSFYLRLWDFDLERAKDGGSLGRRILSNVRFCVSC